MPKKESCDKTAKKIKCDVNNCMYNDCSDECCTLDEIKVSCDCDKNEATEKKETICNSFECNEKCD